MTTRFRTSLLGRFFLILVLLVMELGVMPVQEASASTLMVTTTNDSGPGSLRQAIADAASGDVISFDPSLAGGTITLESDLVLTYTDVGEMSLTIDGSSLSPQVTISGGDVAHLQFSTQTDITISDLTIVHGYGSGIVSGGKLTVINSTIKNNQAVGSGGGIYSSGTLTLKNSTITQNQADAGGGIAITGNAADNSILNSTIAQNTASTGGGISIHAIAAVEVNNSTFAGNSAVQGAEIEMVGPATQLTATNTIFVCTPENTNCYQYSNNIGLTNSILGVGTLGDYGLAALVDNGGPTQTMALLPGSQLIDTGNDTSCETADQRGIARPKGSHCDIGAYEYEDLTPPTVLSIVRADTNPTSASTVNFTVTFSESVINVGTGDFSLATTGVSGAAIANVSGSGAIYTVTGSTGSGSGTIRLDLVDDDSIRDLANMPLGGSGTGNGNYTGGETYDILWITISGNAGVGDATLSYSDGTSKTATADGSGNYSFAVSYNWMGTVTPSKAGYTFSPVSRTYSDVTVNQINQNYTTTPITFTISGKAGVAGAVLSYTDSSLKTATADGSGNYSFSVSYDWSGTVTPSKTGYAFSPANKIYSHVLANQTAQDYTATPITFTISGNAGRGGVVLDYTDGSSKTATADGSGNYTFTVSYNWSGTVTPSKAGYIFSPASKTYTNVLANQPAQNYTATPITFTISGNAGVGGATLSYTDGSSKTATADGGGNYSFTVSYNWSGTVTLSKTGFTFSPASRTYSNVLSDKTAQNYSIPAPSASFDSFPTEINVGSAPEFHIVSTLNISSCSWDYGDGSKTGTSCDSYHTHAYTAAGFYTVSLSVTGPGGTDSLTLTRYITVYPTLVVSKTGNGTGTITSDPGEINCGSSCSGNLDYQTAVTLRAVPAPDSTFVGWNGGGCSGTDSCTINVQTATTVTGHFEKIVASCPTITEWKGEYWVNSSLSGTPVLCRNDASLDFDWGYGSPDPSILPDNFSTQWTRTINLSGGTYLFHIDHDDGARLYVDNMVTPVMDKWGTCCVVDISNPIMLSDGNHVIRMDYYEGGGAANARLWWEKVSPDVTSITRADSDPTSASSVRFNVSFSENVTNVDVSDFSLTTTGITGASVTGVAGSGAARTVTVKTGSGNGTIRLNVADNDSILNGGGFPLGGAGNGNGDFTSAETYTVRKDPTFVDVPTSHPYYQDIEILYVNGLTGGCSTSPLKFCPDQIMNRGQAAVFMLRANFGSSYVPPVPTHVFQDKWSKGLWAEGWAEGMRNKGLSAGCQASPPKYCPWDLMPREQAVVFALRMKYGTLYTPPPATGTLFADLTNPSYYATSWAEQAYKDGLIPNCGMSGGKPKFCPKVLVSRGLAAYMIVRAKNLTMP
jgi:predicted outer membrane repeat protein